MKSQKTFRLLFACIAMALIAVNIQATKPNILFIYSDDQARDEFNFIEEGKLTGTARNLCPNIDGLCDQGMVFTKFYVSSSSCTPSRYSLLTGNYASRSLTPSASKDNIIRIAWNTKIASGDQHVASILKSAGYYTGFVGKNHTYDLDRNSDPAPDANVTDPAVIAQLEANQDLLVSELKTKFEYDFAASIYSGNADAPRLPLELQVHNMDWIFKGGVDFLDSAKQSGKPFYLHLATTITHSPFEDGTAHLSNPLNTPIGYLDDTIDLLPSRETILPRVLAAGKDSSQADVTWMDDGIEALLNKLEELELLDNTIIFYFNDNGVAGGKGSVYELGSRTFGFIWGYGQQGIVYDDYVSNIDICPTIYEMAGIDTELWPEMDGNSLVDILDDASLTQHRSIYLEVGYTRAVIKDDMKYMAWRLPVSMQGQGYYHWGKETTPKPLEQAAYDVHPYYLDVDQLYDVSSDDVTNIETVNLYGEAAYLSDQEELIVELQRYLCELPGDFAELESAEICASLPPIVSDTNSGGTGIETMFADNFRNNPPLTFIRDNALKIVTHFDIDNITLVDMMGRIIYTGKSKEIDLSGLAEQIYILRISSHGIHHTKKFHYIK